MQIPAVPLGAPRAKKEKETPSLSMRPVQDSNYVRANAIDQGNVGAVPNVAFQSNGAA